MKTKLKIFFFSIFIIVINTEIFSQNNSVGINTLTPNHNAVLELISPNNNQGLLVPKLTTSQRTNILFTNNLTGEDSGLLVYDSDLQMFFWWDGSLWKTSNNLNYSAGTGIDVSNGIITNILPSNPTDELITNFSINNNFLELTESGILHTVDLTAFIGSDNQNINSSVLGNEVTISIENGNNTVFSVDDADADPVNEIQTLSLTGNDLNILNGNSVSFTNWDTNVNDDFNGDYNQLNNLPDFTNWDIDVTNDFQLPTQTTNAGKFLTTNGTNPTWANVSISEVDGSVTNEIQDLNFVGNVISLSNDPTPTLIDLNTFMDNTDNQQISISGNTVTLTGTSNSTFKISSNAPLTDQVLKWTGTAWSAGTDNNTTYSAGSGLNLTGTVFSAIDNSATNEIEIPSISGNAGKFLGTDGTAFGWVILPDNSITNEIQALSISGSTISLSNGGGSITLPVEADGNISNELITNFSLSTNTLSLTEAGITKTVDLTGYVNTDAQTLSLSTNNLSISGGNSISLASYLDNTDNQSISISGNTVNLTGTTPTNFTISNDIPANGEVLKWNGTNWIADVDIDTKLNETEVDGFVANNGFLTSESQAISISGNTVNLSGTTPTNFTISNDVPANGEVLKWNGTNWIAETDINTTYTAGSGLNLTGTVFSAIDNSATNEIEIPSITGNGGKYLGTDGTAFGWVILPDNSATNEIELPTQTGNNGKFLSTNGTIPTWTTALISEVDGSNTNEIELPIQTANSGKFLTTNGTTPAWAPALTTEVDGDITNEIELPNQATNSGKFLTTDGISPIWATALTSFTEVDGSITNEIQDLNLNVATNILTITNKVTPTNIDLTPYLNVYSAGTGITLGAGNTINSLWATSGADIIVANSTSNVGIGTNPIAGYKLTINGKLKTTGINELSDERWKKDITTIDNALEIVNQLRGVTYSWRVDEFPDNNFETDKQIGFIAQEVEKVFPIAVDTDANGYKSVEYTHMVALLVEAIKQQQLTIDEQNKEIENLKNENLKTSEKFNTLESKLDIQQQQINLLLKNMESSNTVQNDNH